MRSLLLLALLTLPVAAHAQSTDAETLVEEGVLSVVLPDASVTAGEAFEGIRTGAFLDELGLDSQGLLDDFSLGAQGSLALIRQEGGDNQALAEQVGGGNLAVLLQLGSGIFTSVEQDGQGNVIGVQLVGDGYALGSPAAPGVTQIGNDNVYLLEYDGPTQELAPTTQIGNANQAVQVGSIEVPFGVEQYGEGMRMVIRHNGAE